MYYIERIYPGIYQFLLLFFVLPNLIFASESIDFLEVEKCLEERSVVCNGTTYYVSPNGSDSNPGTLTQPFASMWKVGQVVQAGDVAIFEDGNYIEPNRVDFKTNSGTMDCPIIVKARNQHQAKIVFTTASQGAQSIWIIRPYIVIEGFDLSKEVKGTTTSNQIIRIYGRDAMNEYGNHVTIRGNQIHNAFEEGVKSYETTGLIVEDNIIFDFIHEGIDFVRVENATIRGNEIYDVQRMGILSGKRQSRNIQIYNNYIHISKPMLSCCGYGISIGGTGTETNVTGCYNCIGYNNVIVSEVPGEMLRGLVLFNSENSGYYNNIVIGAREGFYTRKFTNYPPNINPSFKNNIVINSTAVAHNLLANSNTGTIDFDYNLYYNNPTQPTEPNSIYADPQFVNPTSDWHLKSTSPAIDAGIAYTFLDNNGGNIDVTHDKDGNVRSIPWDMGVYEFYTCAVLSVSTVVTNESGSNANDGTISLTANGGSPPYLYVWSNGGNTPVVSNLSGGTYSVTITDAIGCQTVESATVGTVTPNTCASGTTYYVAPNGSDNNPGTLAQPFATMWKVGQVVQAGDVAIFEDGNYIEPHRVDFKTNSGTKDCPIIVKARNQHQAKIVFTTASQGAQSIWIVRPWITIEGFDLSKEVKGTSTSNQIIRIYADTTYSNGVVTDIRRGNYCTVRGNRIHNAYEEGVKSYKSKGLLVEDNIIFDFIHEGIDFVAVDSSIIRGNEVYNVTRMGILAGKGGSRSIQVYNNYVHINNVMPVSGYGISIGGTSTLPIGPAAPTKQLGVACYNCIVYNNLVVSETPGLIQEGLAAFGTRDCGFFNNVVIGADNAFYSRHFHAYTGDTISPVNRNDNLSIKNNIIINSQTSTYDFWAGSLGGIVDFDYNLFFNNPNQPTEPNSVYADPQFVDPASDWHLQGTSPAIEAGIGYTFTGYYGEDIEVTKDWDGSIRTVPWDMGIYEFSGGPPTYIQPDICLWMEGPYDQNTGKMRTTLKQKNILPDNGQPYSVSPWNQTGNNGSGWSTLYPSTMVDWVKVGFRSDVSAASTVVSTTAWLMEDGCLVFLEEELLESYVGNTYYIIVEHRNHLAVMTPTAITLNGDVLSYDFRNGNSYTGGGVGAGQKEILQGVWGMFSGDGEQLLDITGYDINGADQSSWEPQNGLFNMYLSGDYDLNGDVNAGDKVLWNSNNGVFSLIER